MTGPKYLDRTSPPHITTLVLVTATNSLTLNIFLPSLPGMARDFNTSYSTAQSTISLYLCAVAVLQMIVGPASDRYGRRRVLIVSTVLFLLGTVGALCAPTIEVLLAFRALQAFAIAGTVLSRAIVRDTTSTAEAASRIGYVTMGMALVPMIGPIIGGLLDDSFGWKGSFVLLLAYGVVVLAVTALDLGETNRHRTTSMSAQIRTYPELLTLPRFWAFAMTTSFTSGAFFAFVGGAPFVASEILGLSPRAYGLYFAFMGAGYMAGNFLSGRFARRIGLDRMMLAGNIVSSAGILAALILFWGGHGTALIFFGTAGVVGAGNGMTLPSTNAGLVSVRPHLAGSASGLGGTLQMSAAAALSFAAGLLLSRESGAAPLLLLMLFSTALGMASTLFGMYVDRREFGD